MSITLDIAHGVKDFYILEILCIEILKHLMYFFNVFNRMDSNEEIMEEMKASEKKDF